MTIALSSSKVHQTFQHLSR